MWRARCGHQEKHSYFYFPYETEKNSSTQTWFSDLVEQIAQSTKTDVKMFWLYAHLLLTLSLLSRCTPLHLPRLVLT